MDELFATSGDPDQTLRLAASDLGLHCLPVTRLRVSSLQWVTQSSEQGNAVQLKINWKLKKKNYFFFWKSKPQ